MVFIDFPPMILTENDEYYSAVEGKRVMMHCKVFSSPPSAITWYVPSCPDQTSREQQKSSGDCTVFVIGLLLFLFWFFLIVLSLLSYFIHQLFSTSFSDQITAESVLHESTE